MTAITRLRNWLYDPRVRGVDVDNIDMLEIHRSILQEKPILQSTFASFYTDMAQLCDELLVKDGLEIELGSGAGFFKDIRPSVITSDVRRGPHIDRVLDAQNLDLQDSSVRCLYGINVFHHLPDPDKFFKELIRVLKPGGGCILIDPFNGPASATLHKRLHTDEHFDPLAPSWVTADIAGPMSGANQALSYIVFERDADIFKKRYSPDLEIARRTYATNGMRYLLSGGLNFRQLMPSASEPLLRAMERSIGMFAKYWSLHQIVVLRRKAQ